jgi:hypothetical protein
MILQFLCEDAIDPDFNTSLPAKRKDEIIGGLQGALPSLLTFCYEWFCRLVQWQQEMATNSHSTVASMPPPPTPTPTPPHLLSLSSSPLSDTQSPKTVL